MNDMKENRPELLAPAGDMERLQAALDFGADAVYLAGQMFGMRDVYKRQMHSPRPCWLRCIWMANSVRIRMMCPPMQLRRFTL